MALTRISPALALAEAVDRMYDHPWARNGGARFARLPIDVYSTDNEIVLEASLPGIDPEAVEVPLLRHGKLLNGIIYFCFSAFYSEVFF